MIEAEKATAAPFLRVLARGGILWAFIGLCVVLTFLSPAFIAPSNLMNVMRQISVNGILAIGMTFVLISGGIDLSVGSIVALTGVCAAFFARNGGPFPLIVPILLAVAVGGLVGLLNGIGIAFGKYPPFITTLAMMISIRGLAEVLCDGKPVFGLSQAFDKISNGYIGGVPNLVYFIVVLFVIGVLVLRKTVFGKWLYATGGNEESAKLSGVNVSAIKVSVYTISGTLAGLCGLLVASRIASGNPVVASGYELNAIAAAVIGGVSLSGGVGALTGTIIGALIIGVIQNGLDILGVSPFYQQIIQGLIIMAAVFIDSRGKLRYT
jgi:ribose/xylose/arabinose/galactoside ABC-type transport system permease subunit